MKMNKSHNLASMSFIILLSLVFLSAIPSISSDSLVINTFLNYEDSPTSNSKTVTQGDSFNLVLVAYGHGESMEYEKLELVSSTLIFEEHVTGDQILEYTYLYSKTYTLNTGILTPGDYTLRFTAKTSVTGSEEYSDLHLIILPRIIPDTTNPVVDITYPIATTYSSQRTNLTFSVSDNNLNSCTYKLNNGAQVNVSSLVNGVNTITGITSVTGINTWSVTCRDNSGNTGSDSVTFTVTIIPTDTTNPVVDITYPIATTYSSQRTNLTFSVSDNNLNSCTYKLNNGTQVNVSSLVNGVNVITGITSVTGINTWSVTCRDNSGNTGSDSVTFTVTIIPTDTTNPVVDITYPIATTYSSQRTNLTFSVSDNNLNSCTYKLNNGTQVNVSSLVNGVNVITGITSVTGINTWSVTCRDNSGNTGSDSVTFTVTIIPTDTTNPVVDITYPIATTYSSQRTNLTFSVSDNNLNSCTYKLNNGTQVNVSSLVNGVNVITGITSVTGINTWSVTCRDNSGNTGSDSVTFTVTIIPTDTTNPVVDITYPIATTYSSQRTNLTFSVSDNNLNSCTYKLNNGTQVNVSSLVNGVNVITGITSVTGINTWSVTCRDNSGNTGSDSVTFTVKMGDGKCSTCKDKNSKPLDDNSLIESLNKKTTIILDEENSTVLSLNVNKEGKSPLDYPHFLLILIIGALVLLILIIVAKLIKR